MPIHHVEFAHLHSEGGKHLCGSYYRLRFVFDWVLLKWVAHCTAHEEDREGLLILDAILLLIV
jgi:hypothetical protein